MKISQWEVENYKSIEQDCFSPRDLTILIGKNNSGKSSVIDSLLDFKEYHSNGRQVLPRNWVEKRYTGKLKDKSYNFNITFSLSGEEHQDIINIIQNNNDGKIISGAPSPDEISEAGWLSEIKYQIEYSPSRDVNLERYVNFDGVMMALDRINGSKKIHNANLRNEITSIVNKSIGGWSFVLPFRNPRDTMDAKYSVDLDSEGRNLVQVLDSLDRNRTHIFDDIAEAYVEIMAGVTDLDIEYKPDGGPREITVAVYEEYYDNRFELDEISSGSQEILVLLTQLFLAAEESDILAIEEPELHLHPEAEQKIFDIISEIVTERNTQVIVSTHSEVFVNQGQVQEIIRVEREGTTDLRSVPEEKVSTELSDMGYQKSGLLQSDAVVFVEGRSDKLILAQWASTLDMDLESTGISLIELEGEGNIQSHGRSLVKLLDSFDIPYQFIVDSDESDPEEVEHGYVHNINREEDTWWYTTPEYFHAWQDSDIEYFLLQAPRAIAETVGTSEEQIRRIISTSEAEKNAEVLDEIWSKTHEDLHDEVGYRKDADGMSISRHMDACEIDEEVKQVLEEIAELP